MYELPAIVRVVQARLPKYFRNCVSLELSYSLSPSVQHSLQEELPSSVVRLQIHISIASFRYQGNRPYEITTYYVERLRLIYRYQARRQAEDPKILAIMAFLVVPCDVLSSRRLVAVSYGILLGNLACEVSIGIVKELYYLFYVRFQDALRKSTIPFPVSQISLFSRVYQHEICRLSFHAFKDRP